MTPAPFIAAAIPLAWLLPQHYLPWLTAHQDLAALLLLLTAGALTRSAPVVPRTWAFAIGLALVSVVAQAATGKIRFLGDAWLATLYLLAFGSALSVGSALADPRPGSCQWHAIDSLAIGTTVAAVVSVAVGLMQWTSVQPLPIPVAQLQPGDRPYANFAQANHFCTATFMGLCALGWLREARRIGPIGWFTATAFLLLGMVLSGSRTGWLQLAAMLLVVGVVLRRTPQAVLRVHHLIWLALLFVLLQVLWPAINEWTLLAGSRGLSDQVQAGQRPTLWWALLDAVFRQPLWGYGWQQVPSAQWAVALDHAPLQRYFEHSHNIALDL